MAYAVSLGSSTVPIAPTVNLFPAAKTTAELKYQCPGGVCVTEYHDKVFRYMPNKELFTWHFLLTYAPLIALVILLLALIAWIPTHYNRRYKAYEDALEQRLIDAMDDEEREVKV